MRTVTKHTEAVLGIDLGTQGVRVVAVDQNGTILGTSAMPMPPQKSELPEGWHEQNPEDWWLIICHALNDLIQTLPQEVTIKGICADSTSGSLVIIDGDGIPLHPAILYNDTRSRPFVAEIRQVMTNLEERLGIAFSSSFALPKIVWLQRTLPQLFDKTAYFLSATDFIVGRLTGEYGVSDFNNALKTGYDVLNLNWPREIESELGVPIAKLPRIVSPGTLIARTSAKCAHSTLLGAGIPVYAGATDGTAAQYASGAVTAGAWNSTLGTTLVIKGISQNFIIDPQKRIYCHRHPEGWWMPGGASNTGCEWINAQFPHADPGAMDFAAEKCLPTSLVCYPLARRGERFPFIAPDATGFLLGEVENDGQRFAAGLEGTAMVERLSFELLQSVGAPLEDPIFVTGGSARSDIWLKLRATVLNHVLVRPQFSDTCMGAAILAASGCWYHNLNEAAKNLIRLGGAIQPNQELLEIYEEKYSQFKSALIARNYLS